MQITQESRRELQVYSCIVGHYLQYKVTIQADVFNTALSSTMQDMTQYEPSKMTYFTTSFLVDQYNHVAGVQKVMGMTSVSDLTWGPNPTITSC